MDSAKNVGPVDAITRRVGGAAIQLAGDAGFRLNGVLSDLAVAERNPEEHIAATLASAVAAPAVLVVGSTLMRAFGVGAVPRLPWLAVAAALGGAVLPRLAVRTEARRRRAEFAQTVEYVMLLASSVVAGGASVDSALRAATRPGDNWAAERLRAALDGAWTFRLPPWEALHNLAIELDAPDLADLAAKIARTGTHGAAVRERLLIQAREVRTRRRHDEAAAARAATARMPFAIAWIAYSFLGLVAYLAFAQIIGSIS
jgi:Flp pilus assembly protein TadB